LFGLFDQYGEQLFQASALQVLGLPFAYPPIISILELRLSHVHAEVCKLNGWMHQLETDVVTAFRGCHRQ